jgi:hypothetical protein
MIFAELRGKLQADSGNADDHAEDLLTSTVFGLLRYIAPAEGLLAVLRRARAVTMERDAGWLDTARVATVKVDFWPHWPGYGEPDVLLTLLDAERKPLVVVLVEAKFHAPAKELARTDSPDGEQLVRYWQGLQSLAEVRSGADARLIYLSRHAVPPADDLAEPVRRVSDMQLAWLSWRDIWEVAQGLRETSLPAADVARLLAFKGLNHFNGFRAGSWQVPPVAQFWRQHAWFSGLPPWRPVSSAARFWIQARRS